jgi:hypothetical protein
MNGSSSAGGFVSLPRPVGGEVVFVRRNGCPQLARISGIIFRSVPSNWQLNPAIRLADARHLLSVASRSSKKGFFGRYQSG